jgi:hypothetical protein
MKIAIIGGGPAGLRAAEVAAAGGAAVALYDAKASVGRKFLVAGKGGLNLTNTEPREAFVARYIGAGDWPALIAGFDAEALRAWAAGLGVETFAASTGRVYPRGMKAAPLLRLWVRRLRGLGVEFSMHHRWTGLERGAPLRLEFSTPDGARTVAADAAILALGGGSWPDTGSDGAWVATLARLGVEVAPLVAANCGWNVAWPPEVLAVGGQPLKNVRVRAGGTETRGELMVTRHGLEGGAIYALGPALRAMERPSLTLDFKPDLTAARLLQKLGTARRNLPAEARARWRLGGAAAALLATRGPFDSAEALVATAKAFPLVLTGPRPLAEAISTAGGVRGSELDEALMLRRLPGVFVAGEMVDWEAPTGGYLIQGCLATATRAAQAALGFAKKSTGAS